MEPANQGVQYICLTCWSDSVISLCKVGAMWWSDCCMLNPVPHTTSHCHTAEEHLERASGTTHILQRV